LAGVQIAANQDGEWVVLSVEGTPEYQVVPLEDNSGLAIVLAGCELADGFQLPSLETGSVISSVEYRLTLLAGTQSVELTIHMRDGAYKGYDVDTSQPGILKIGLAPEVVAPVVEPASETPSEVVQDVEVMWYGPQEGDADAIYRIDSISVEPSGETESVRIVLDKPATPNIRKFSYPNRVVFELEGGYLAEDVDQYLYSNRNGLVTKVDILFSPQQLAGVFQLIISCPEMGDFNVTQNGSEYIITISREAADSTAVEETPVETPVIDTAPTPTEEATGPEVLPENPPAAVEETAPVVEETPVEAPTTPEAPVAVETASAPSSLPEPIMALETVQDTPSDSPGSSFYEYPEVPIATEDIEQGVYNFPQAEESIDPNHVSDAIISLNVTSADFQAVMMILAEQAGVNFVLDAYWRSMPSGFVREQFRPPGGPGGTGQTGGFGRGGGFNPTDSGGGGSVTMHLSEVPFDTAFGMLMQANNLRFTVFRYTEDTDPILFISSRERIEQELGLGSIQIYHLHYIDSGSAFDFLRDMDLLPTTSGYGIWEYGGGGSNGNNGGGNNNGGGGGNNFSSNQPGSFMSAVGGTPAVDYGNYMNSYGYYGPEQMQAFGGGGSSGGGGRSGGGGGGSNNGGGNNGGGGNGGGGNGQIATAKGGAIGIIATQETHDKIREALVQIDKPPKMIFVEATFITYDETNPNNNPIGYGLENIGDWALEFGGDRFYSAFDASGSEGLVFEILPKNQRMPFDDFRARFHYLFADRNAKIISEPRVAVIDGFTATINVTENRPFIVDGGVVIDQFGNPIPAPDIVTFVPTGTTLTITPYIDDYGNVTMNMSPTNTTLLGEPTLVNGNLIFGTANSSISTVLRMRDGETIILGGLKIKNRDETRNRIPLLGDIPFIGAIFGNTTIVTTESQLIILMTVHLVGN